jgi:hypothetical protein
MPTGRLTPFTDGRCAFADLKVRPFKSGSSLTVGGQERPPGGGHGDEIEQRNAVGQGGTGCRVDSGNRNHACGNAVRHGLCFVTSSGTNECNRRMVADDQCSGTSILGMSWWS